MRQKLNWQTIYALMFALVVSSAWAEEKKQNPVRPATAPKCCYELPATACSKSGEPCTSCNSPSCSKLVTRIHPLAAFFEAMEQMEEREGYVPGQGPSYGQKEKKNLEDQIIKLITNHIKPASWSVLGGEGTIDYYPLGKALVISQKAETQEQIVKFLEDLRSLVETEQCAEQDLPRCPPAPTPAMVCMPRPAPVPAMAYVPQSMVWAPAPMNMYPPPVPMPGPFATYQPAPAACPFCPAMPAPAQFPAMKYQHEGPSATELLPPPRPVSAPMNPVMQCLAPPPVQAENFSCIMRAKSEGGKNRLECENCSGSCRGSFESMEWKTGSDTLKLTAQQNQIQINGQAFRATADTLKSNGGEDWILEGHVQMNYKKDGTSAQISGDRVIISLKGGQVEFKFHGASHLDLAIQPTSNRH